MHREAADQRFRGILGYAGGSRLASDTWHHIINKEKTRQEKGRQGKGREGGEKGEGQERGEKKRRKKGKGWTSCARATVVAVAVRFLTASAVLLSAHRPAAAW